MTKEVKDHNITKKTLIALKEENNNCKEELRIVQEEKERLKTERNDLKKVNTLTQTLSRDTSQRKSSNSIIICDICEYPFKEQTELNDHHKKHNMKLTESDSNQSCGFCGLEFSSNN